MEIGDRIIKYRKRANMTQEELAKSINTSPQNIYKYEQNVIKSIPLSRIESIARVLDVSPTVLVGWEADPNEADGSPPEIWVRIYTIVGGLDSYEQNAFGEEFLQRLNGQLPEYRAELRLLSLYRRADEIDRQTIKNILSRYDEDGASARSSTG